MLHWLVMEQRTLVCEQCGEGRARHYQLFSFGAVGEPSNEQRFRLCPTCARARRKSARHNHPREPRSLSRAEVIAELNRFFAESGALEICRRCHEQGTGCCPPSCRALGGAGCTNKNLFCAGFVCSALLNAIAECDAEIGRKLKWVKQHLGSPEFRVYELMTRVPAADREPERPLALPKSYPSPLDLGDAPGLSGKLQALLDEVLEIRRRWGGKPGKSQSG